MIRTEVITINGRELVRTYSDAGYMIERGGVLYGEAVDPPGSGREYAETNETVPEEDDEYIATQELLDKFAEGVNSIDYISL